MTIKLLGFHIDDQAGLPALLADRERLDWLEEHAVTLSFHKAATVGKEPSWMIFPDTVRGALDEHRKLFP